MLSYLQKIFRMPEGCTIKEKFLRGLLGIPIGITICTVISIIISIYINETGDNAGIYYPCSTDLINAAGSELNAVIIQLLLSAALGFVMGAATIIWKFENWSIVKQSGVFFIITAIAMLSISWLLYWMEHTVMGFLRYLLNYSLYFVIIWLIIWLIEYISVKSKVKKFNEKIRNKTINKS